VARATQYLKVWLYSLYYVNAALGKIALARVFALRGCSALLQKISMLKAAFLFFANVLQAPGGKNRDKM